MTQVITLEELQTYSTETIDAGRGQLVVDAVNDYIESYTGRSWGSESTATETHDYRPVIFLRHMDVKGVTSVERGLPTATRTPIEPNVYYVDEFGRLVLSDGRLSFGSTYRDQVRVTYTYGTDDVPADLKLSALAMASDFSSFASNNGTQLTSEGIGSYRMTYASGSDTSTGKAHLAVIDSYRARDL